ncbi:MAG: 5-deoxy-glucuronate isomerase [Candidatus Lokiarchaeota archaeon]|nr:5-deoxy-glucuronate isomerase [Candidatus Lokiarchaeota archaeon]
MKIPAKPLVHGMNWITRFDALSWDDSKNTKMNFGFLVLEKGQAFVLDHPLEKAILLMKGDASLSWKEKGASKGVEIKVKRESLFDENPPCLHVPASTVVSIKASLVPAELCILMTRNDGSFPATFYEPKDCRSELRGEGTLREASTRIVRTIFDHDNAPDAQLVLGEVITYPGKWSSYPPHHHPQPEIYHYRFQPENGFGFAMLGDEVVKVRNGDTVGIFGVSHPQTAAPGYAMYYLWAIRHLDDKPYGTKFGTPIFEDEHAWTMKKENDVKIWPHPAKSNK